jgi:hypothetical protein
MLSVDKLGCAEMPLRGDDARLEVAEEGGTLRGSGGLPAVVAGGGRWSCLAKAGCCGWDCSEVAAAGGGGGSCNLAAATSAAAADMSWESSSTISALLCNFVGAEVSWLPRLGGPAGNICVQGNHEGCD